MNWISNGEVKYDLWVKPNSSSNGAIPGTIIPGDWYLQLDISNLTEDTDFHFQICLEPGKELSTVREPLPDQRVLNTESGWYQGELHSHSIESDGDFSVEEVLQTANKCNLDFIALTDHFTSSPWWRMEKIHEIPKCIWLNSIEITSHQGHANLHGISKWVNVFVDQKTWSMNQAADETHQMGGLFCINHAFSGELGWSDFTFDWSKADLFETFHLQEGPNNNLQISLWDSLLREGYRIIGVAGTDFHGNRFGNYELGKVRTYIYCDELSVNGLLEGLKRGRVYVSFDPEFDFSIENNLQKIAAMGDSIESNNQSVKVKVKIKTDEPVRAFILKNGFNWRSKIIKPDKNVWQEYEENDDFPVKGYYRVEIHNLFESPNYDGIEWRDFSTIQVISNPIWIY